MPEMTFAVRWPDGAVQECYSPSLVMHDHLSTGSWYSVDEFRRRAETALGRAAERVRTRYGFSCTSAQATTEQIRAAVARFAGDDRVEVVTMHPPLPATAPERS
ncbi:MSMEG_0570 family nitrogen starvation response protein [Tsukamurella soli]|uniref:MSMEG_0570 family nitrogen starvation response protein n=1 Tax=Tsukamurella soli TaxID=644556 RepID=A0ABP8JUT5_9ACTN